MRRVVAPLMNAMKLADAGSIGAAETSAFHQLSAGKSGSGPGSAPPSVLAARTTIADAQMAAIAPARIVVVRERIERPSASTAPPLIAPKNACSGRPLTILSR